MKKIRTMLCDDYKYICEYFKSSLSEYDDIDVVAVANSSEEAMQMVAVHKPDVAILDIQIESERSGIELIPQIEALSPETKIIIFSIHEEPKLIYEAIVLGANGYFLKSIEVDEMAENIRSIYNGKNVFPPFILEKFIDESRSSYLQRDSLLYTVSLLKNLSASEFEILKLASQGKSSKEIAAQRFVEQSTIRCQITNILKKTKQKNLKEFIATLNKLHVLELFEKID